MAGYSQGRGQWVVRGRIWQINWFINHNKRQNNFRRRYCEAILESWQKINDIC